MLIKNTTTKLIGLLCLFCLTSSLASQVRSSPTVTYSAANGLVISNQAQSFQIHPHGYAMLDMFKTQGDIPELIDSANIRWLRLYLSGTVLTDWSYSFGHDFAPNHYAGLTDAYIVYNGWQNMFLGAGQFIPPVTLSGRTDYNNTDFLEIPLSTFLFTPDYGRGVAYSIYNSQLALHTSIYGPGVDQDFSGRMPLSAAAALVFSPFHEQTRALSFGASAWHRQTDNTNTDYYYTPPELVTRNYSTELLPLNTDLISNVENVTSGAVEAAYVRGPWSGQAEYIYNLLKRNMGSQDLKFNGCYAAIGYFFTGESVSYSFPVGVFTGIDHINNQRLGAWQVVARISYANLNDKDVSGGKETNAALGLNWYINNFLQLKANYIRAMVNLPNTDERVNANIYVLRAQVQF